MEFMLHLSFYKNLFLIPDGQWEFSSLLPKLKIALKPKATYYDLVLQTKNAVNITTIAKDYGLSAVSLNKKLHEYGVQYKQGSTWLLYQKYADMGYTKSMTGVYTNNAGEEYAAVHTRWTQKGRLFIYEVLKEHGILPKVEVEEENNENVIQFSVV